MGGLYVVTKGEYAYIDGHEVKFSAIYVHCPCGGCIEFLTDDDTECTVCKSQYPAYQVNAVSDAYMQKQYDQEFGEE